jgi:hypothetical protein
MSHRKMEDKKYFRNNNNEEINFKSFNKISDKAVKRYEILLKKVIEAFEDRELQVYEIQAIVENHLIEAHYCAFASKLKDMNLYVGRVEDKNKKGQTNRQKRLGRLQKKPTRFYEIRVYRTYQLRNIENKRLRQALNEEIDEEEDPLRIPWTEIQVKALTEGFDRYKDSESLWANIKKDRAYHDILRNKSNVALKDKARNLGKNGDISMGRSEARRALGDDDEDNEESDEGEEDDKEEDGRWIKRRKINEGIYLRPERTRWTDVEEEALVEGYKKYTNEGCKLPWAMILKDDKFGIILENRSNINLKDKMRNLRRRSS